MGERVAGYHVSGSTLLGSGSPLWWVFVIDKDTHHWAMLDLNFVWQMGNKGFKGLLCIAL